MNTSGFYKLLDNQLLYGKVVVNKDYNLDENTQNEIIDGWQWFNTKEEAEQNLGIKILHTKFLTIEEIDKEIERLLELKEQLKSLI